MRNLILFAVLVTLALLCNAQTVTDIDGNVYKTVSIGRQTWMKENLRTTHYANGTAIPKVEDNSEWIALRDTSKAYCWYRNDTIWGNRWGALYTWAASMNGAASSSAIPSGIQGVCPSGWHLPSDPEWTVLENYLIANHYNFDSTTTGNKIAKALASETGWKYDSGTGTVGNTDYPTYRNRSGFTALPGGFRDYYDGTFFGAESFGFWWSSTEMYDITAVYYRNLGFGSIEIYTSTGLPKWSGFSVRCVDNNIPSIINSIDSKEVIIYPNPAAENLYFNNINCGNTLIMIFDLQGRQVLIKQIDLNPIDISSLRHGIYVIKLVGSGNVLITKLIKE